MSKTKWFLLLLILPVILFWSSPASSAAANINGSKTLGKNIKTYSYVDQNGVTQIATIDCSWASGLAGFKELCGVVKGVGDAIDSLGTSITTAMGQMASNLIELFKTKAEDIITAMTTGGLKVTSRLLSGEPASYSATSDTQIPKKHDYPPLSLLMLVYKNPPNLYTQDSLAYTVNNNILGIKPALAQLECSKDPANGFYFPGPGLQPETNICPGRLRLTPMFRIWEGIRNIAYLIITLVLVIYGFMVMFRSKIDPRTVITAQSALPRLAIGLVAIAFSYIIASLAVDLGQVLLAAISTFFRNLVIGPDAPPCVVQNAPCLVMPYLQSPLDLLSGLGTAFDYKTPAFTGWQADLVSTLMQMVTWYIFFQVFFALVSNYAQIFVKTVLGPILIAVGIIPTQSDSIAKWFKGILANALVFPGIYFVLDMAAYINNYSADLFLPSPLIQSSVKGFVILGLVVIATKVPAMIEEFLQVGQSGAVSRAGADVQQAARKIPVIGSIIG